MSAVDFQTKYSSVMESMLKSAVAETTKLFETMVEDLKAEISQMKKENEDLKTRCSQLENARNQPTVYTRESEAPPGPWDGSKCDRAVQCDIVPFRTVLVEQCQPLRHSSVCNQEQQSAYEQTEYSLQDHTYGEGTTQMALTLIKQEESYDDCYEDSILKQKNAQSTGVCGLDMSDKAGSPQACACGTENEGPGETGKMPLPQKEQETQEDLELPCLEIDRGLQGALNHSSELERSLAVSPAAMKNNIGDSSEVSLKITEAQQELVTEKHPLVIARHQSEVEPLSAVLQQYRREGKMSINEQVHVSQQQCADVQSTEQQLAKPISLKGDAAENVKSSVAEGGARPQTESVVKGRRGRPPKKSKRLQQRVKETGSQTVSVAALSKGCFSEKDKLSESQQLSVQMEEGPIEAPSTEGSSAIDTLNTQPVVPKERCTSVTLQDAMLLVEAMNQSTADNTVSSPQRTPAPCSPPVGMLETVTEVLEEPQRSLLPVETRKAAGNLPVTELSAATQPSTEQLGAASVTSEAQAHIKGVTSKQHMVTPSNTSTSSVELSSVAVQTHVQSLQNPPPPRIKLLASGKQAVSHKIIAMPTCRRMSTVVVAQPKNSIQPSRSSVPPKTIYIMSRKSLPVVPSQLTATSTDLQSEGLPHPKITIIIPKQVSAVSSRNPQPQTTIVTTNHKSTRSAASVTASSPRVLNIFVDMQTVSDKVAQISSQEKGKPSDNLESPKQMTFVSEQMNVPPDVCSSFNKSVDLMPASESLVVPATFDQKHSAVVRLTRLPFPVSTKESVFVSRMPADGYSESTDGFSEMQSTLKDSCIDRGADDGLSCVVPSETLVLSTSKETFVALCRNTSQMTAEQTDNGEKTSPAPRNCTILEEESPDTGPSTSSKMAVAVFEKSTLAVNMTGAPADTVGEATSNSDDKISSIKVQECPSPTDPPIEEKQSTALIHQASITTEDTSDPHLQLTKSQFLAKLAVTPVIEDPGKASSEDSVTAAAFCAETSGSNEERLRRISFMTQLQRHLRAHLKARTAETNPESCNETKKHRSENDVPNDKNTTREPVFFSLKDIISPKMTANDPTPVSPRRSGSCKAGVGSKKTEPTSRLFMATRKSNSGSTRRSDSMQQNVNPEKTKSTSVSPRRSSKQKTDSPLLRQRRSTSVKDSTSVKKTKSTSVSSRRSSSTKQRGSPKETKNVSMRPKRISSARDDTSPKIVASPKSMKTSSVSCPSKSAFSPRTSSSSKNAATPKVTTNESFCRRRCTFPKDSPCSKQVEIDSKSFSPGVRWPKLSKDEVSPTKMREPPPTKKPRLSEDVAGPKKNLGVVGANKLAKANTVDKMKKSSQLKLQNGAKTSQSVENHVTYEAVRKCITKAVWTPPQMSVFQTPPACEKEEPCSPSPQDAPLVYPPSVSLLPIPVKAPPVVSPLQPLSVIGRHLLKNQCGECGRVLSSVAALESHVSLHAGRRPFSCTLCGKRFPDSKGLKRHGRVHRNGRIHMCLHCGKGFVYRFGLTKHLMMVHRKIKPFICQICNKGFFTKRDVEAHIRMHTGEKPFHCNLCEKKFARRVELNVHLRWHNGEKRHWCPFCGKGFLDLNNLKRHKYIHTGEKPHSCPHCPKKFTQSGHLKKHVKNVHKILDA